MCERSHRSPGEGGIDPPEPGGHPEGRRLVVQFHMCVCVSVCVYRFCFQKYVHTDIRTYMNLCRHTHTRMCSLSVRVCV